MISEDAKDDLLAAEAGRWKVVYVSHTQLGYATYIQFEAETSDMAARRYVEGAYFKYATVFTTARDFHPADGRFSPNIQRFLDDCHQQCIDVRFEAAP